MFTLSAFADSDDANVTCDTLCITPDDANDTTVEILKTSITEPSLQKIFDTNLVDLNVTADQKQYQIWRFNGEVIVGLDVNFLANYAGAAMAFGYYLDENIANFTPLFQTIYRSGNRAISHAGYPDLPILTAQTTMHFEIPRGNNIGFAISTYKEGRNPSTLFYTTQQSFNRDLKDRAVVYDLCNEYIIGFEDGGDNDFQDMVVRFRVVRFSDEVACELRPYCGNGVKDADIGEECDGLDGVPPEHYICTEPIEAVGGCTLEYVPYCGDGVRDVNLNEECDISDFGGATCETFSFGSTGSLRCINDCVIDTSGCTSPTNLLSIKIFSVGKNSYNEWVPRTSFNKVYGESEPIAEVSYMATITNSLSRRLNGIPVKIELFDSTGNLLETIMNDTINVSSGSTTLNDPVAWTKRDLGEGNYYFRATVDFFQEQYVADNTSTAQFSVGSLLPISVPETDLAFVPLIALVIISILTYKGKQNLYSG